MPPKEASVSDCSCASWREFERIPMSALPFFLDPRQDHAKLVAGETTWETP